MQLFRACGYLFRLPRTISYLAVRSRAEKMKVLIADDNATSRIMLRGALLQWGYEVVVAENGAQAWDVLAAETDSPPLAILDWVMPHMTGPEVCKRVRETHREPYTYI